MPTTVIAERIGSPYSIRLPSGRVAQRRPWYLPVDSAGRTSYAPGRSRNAIMLDLFITLIAA
jgi:hypothetical protein